MRNLTGATILSSLLNFGMFAFSTTLTLFSLVIFGADLGWGKEGQKAPLPLNLPHISYNDETWYSYNLSKEDPKAFFHPKSASFVI